MAEGRTTAWSEKAEGQMPDVLPIPSRVRGLLFDSTINKLQWDKNIESNMDGGHYDIYFKETPPFVTDIDAFTLLTAIEHNDAPDIIQYQNTTGKPGRLYIVQAVSSQDKKSIPSSPVWWPDPNYFCLIWVKHADINLSPLSGMTVKAHLVIPESEEIETFGPLLIIVSNTIETFQKNSESGEFTSNLLRNSVLPSGSYYNFTISGQGANRQFLNKTVPDKMTEALINL
jgi:hypothetical protein